MMEKLREDEDSNDSGDDDSRVVDIPPTINTTVISYECLSLSPDEASQEPPSMVTKLSKLGRKKENQAQKTQKT